MEDWDTLTLLLIKDSVKLFIEVLYTRTYIKNGMCPCVLFFFLSIAFKNKMAFFNAGHLKNLLHYFLKNTDKYTKKT